MKRVQTRFHLSFFALAATLWFTGCGEVADTADDAVIVLNVNAPSDPALPEASDGPVRTFALAELEAHLGEQAPTVNAGIVQPAPAAEPILGPGSLIEPSVEADPTPSMAELGAELLNRDFFQHRLSLASSDDRVFVAADSGDGIRVGIYDEDLAPEAVFDLQKTLEPQYHSACHESLRILNLQSHLGVVESSCGDDIQLNVRYFSFEGEEIGENTRFSISEAEQISISNEHNRVVILSVKEDEVTWFELSDRGGVNRVLSHELTPEDGERRLMQTTHNGARALLQYSDGLLRRVSYALRCGSTTDVSLRLEQAEGGRFRPFTWDAYSGRYMRYVGLVDGQDRIESFAWQADPTNPELRTSSVPRDPEIDRYMQIDLVSSVDGPRLLFNSYSHNEFTVGGLPGAPNVIREKRIHGGLGRSWSLFGGRGSVFLFTGRCVEPLHFVQY
jgi:hypothetical protein